MYSYNCIIWVGTSAAQLDKYFGKLKAFYTFIFQEILYASISEHAAKQA